MAIIWVNDVSSSAPAVQPKAPQVREKFGLAHWMSQVLEECDRAEAEFAKDPVHDLRVALRRCRSMADGLMAIDPSPEWRRMKKAGKQLFSALGNLRDAQVMTDWIEELSSPEDPVAKVLATYAAAHEHGSKQSAQAALHHFDRKRWAGWMDELPQRAIRIPLGGPVFLTWPWNAGTKPMNCIGGFCAVPAMLPGIGSALQSRNSATSLRIFYRRCTIPGSMISRSCRIIWERFMIWMCCGPQQSTCPPFQMLRPDSVGERVFWKDGNIGLRSIVRRWLALRPSGKSGARHCRKTTKSKRPPSPVSDCGLGSSILIHDIHSGYVGLRYNCMTGC